MNLLALVGFELKVFFRAILNGVLDGMCLNFAREGIPGSGNSTGERTLSKCFGLNTCSITWSSEVTEGADLELCVRVC